MKDFINYCKDYIYEHLPEHEGEKVWLDELGYELTEGPNCDGSLTMNRVLAADYLREWWYDAADYFDYERDNFGTNHNPFENPEGYMVCMVIEGVRSLIDAATPAVEYDQDEVEVTKELIDSIVKSVANDCRERLF